MRFPPAPLLIAAVLTTWCSTPAFTQEIPVGVRACAAQADPALRLACYDRQIPPQKPVAAAAPAPRVESALPAAAAPRHIRSISARPRVPPEYTLDDGEVWRQVDTSPFSIQVGDAVTVQPGPMGGLWLQTDARHGTRVARVH